MMAMSFPPSLLQAATPTNTATAPYARSPSTPPLQLRISPTATERLHELKSHSSLILPSTLKESLDSLFPDADSVGAIAEQSRIPDGLVLGHDALARISTFAITNAPVLLQHGIDPDHLTLYALTRCAKLHFPPKPKFERSPELERSLAAIRLANEKAEYERISALRNPVQNKRTLFSLAEPPRAVTDEQTGPSLHALSVQTLTPEQEAQQWAEANKQISAVINVVISMGAVATAAWWAAGSAIVIWKTLVCLALAILVGIAETVMYARYWRVATKQAAVRAAKMRGFQTGVAPSLLSFGVKNDLQ